MATIIKFKGHYNASDFTNQQIINVFRTCDPDVDLIASNGKIVPAHRVILAMYSKYLRRILSLSNPEEKFIGKYSLISCEQFSFDMGYFENKKIRRKFCILN